MTNPQAPEINDLEMVRRAKSGELGAFETLTTRYEQRVFSLAMRMLRQEQDAEDVTQQTFLSALEHLNGFRAEASFATWLVAHRHPRRAQSHPQTQRAENDFIGGSHRRIGPG